MTVLLPLIFSRFIPNERSNSNSLLIIQEKGASTGKTTGERMPLPYRYPPSRLQRTPVCRKMYYINDEGGHHALSGLRYEQSRYQPFLLILRGRLDADRPARACPPANAADSASGAAGSAATATGRGGPCAGSIRSGAAGTSAYPFAGASGPRPGRAAEPSRHDCPHGGSTAGAHP